MPAPGPAAALLGRHLPQRLAPPWRGEHRKHGPTSRPHSSDCTRIAQRLGTPNCAVIEMRARRSHPRRRPLHERSHGNLQHMAPAAMVVEGDVIAAHSHWTDDRSRIVTEATVQTPDGTVVVSQLGGSVDGLRRDDEGIAVSGRHPGEMRHLSARPGSRNLRPRRGGHSKPRRRRVRPRWPGLVGRSRLLRFVGRRSGCEHGPGRTDARAAEAAPRDGAIAARWPDPIAWLVGLPLLFAVAASLVC